MDKQKLLKTIVHLLIIGILISPAFLYLFADQTLRFQPPVSPLISYSLLTVFYLANIFWLIPTYIYRRSYKAYSLGILLMSVIYVALPLTGGPPAVRPTAEFRMRPPDENIQRPGAERVFVLQRFRFLFFFPDYFRLLLGLGLGTTLELLFLYDAERRRNDDMEKQKAITDLNFLKNQLNPHFLLNSLNNIYSLARKKSEDTTRAILLLSDLLRHVLYESGKNKISLGDEISFIKNYINLEKLKFSEENGPNVNFTVSVRNADYPIVPLLMMTLVENAFKHGISYLQPSFILISLEENDREVRFSVVNSIHRRESLEPQPSQKGLGIKNLDKQLNLSYPNKYSFTQKIENNLFKTFLSIKK
jgi:two-component system LytT family sensor kinase